MPKTPGNTSILEIRDLIDALLDKAAMRLPTENGHNLNDIAMVIQGHIGELNGDIDTSGGFNDLNAERNDRPFISNMEAAFHALQTQTHLENNNLTEAIKSIVLTYSHLGGAEKRDFEIKDFSKEQQIKSKKMLSGRKEKSKPLIKRVQELIEKGENSGGEKPSSGWASIDQAANAIGACIAITIYTNGKCNPSCGKECSDWFTNENLKPESIPTGYYRVEGLIESNEETRALFKKNASSNALKRIKK